MQLQIPMPPKTSPTVNLFKVTVTINGATREFTSLGPPVVIPIKPGDSGTVAIVQSSPLGGDSLPGEPVPFSAPAELPPPKSGPPVLSFIH